MDEKEYARWIALYIGATGFTGANEDRLNEVLAANRHIFAELRATFPELCECTDRLVERAEVPQWPSEHTNALLRELKNLRDERTKRAAKGTYGGGNYTLHASGCPCHDCTARPSHEKLSELKAYIRRHGGQVAGEGPKAKRKVKK